MAVIGALLSDHAGLLTKGAALENATKAAQQSALQAQLQPHALFNSLNAMAELVHKNPAHAEDYIRHTSEWMREVLLCSSKEFHPLLKERAMVENYLAMEFIRIGPRLDLEWDWDATLDPARVPPLTLQPLVENALKHGIARVSAERSTIRLMAKREGSRMILEIENPCPKASSPAQGTGTGLANLRQRLSLAFGVEAGIEFQTDGLTALARLSLPIQEG
ncbi:MAG TPA: histidine kinase [Holophagaceae bacterium]|nr:histidine kinase [Holophagaceae bacterium]